MPMKNRENSGNALHKHKSCIYINTYRQIFIETKMYKNSYRYIHIYVPKIPMNTGNTVGTHCTNIRAVDGQVKAVPLQGSTCNLCAGGDAIHLESSVFKFIL
jgi:hypothetical protein